MIDGSDLPGRVRRVIATTFRLDEAAAGRGPLRMGAPPQWDSLAHMNLVLALEREFGVAFPTYRIAELSSEDRIAAAVAELGGR